MNQATKSTLNAVCLLMIPFVTSFCLTNTSAFAQSAKDTKVDSYLISDGLNSQIPTAAKSGLDNLSLSKPKVIVDSPWSVKVAAIKNEVNFRDDTTATISRASEIQDESDTGLILQEEEQRRQRPEFGDWPKKGIRGITIGIRETSDVVPEDLAGQLIKSAKPRWTHFAPSPKVFAWAAPDIRYQPLYFEDVALERYGQTLSPYRQTIKSSVHFFKSVVFLPNKMRHDAPASCDYPLGFCRPGDPTPTTYQRQYYGRPGR